VEKVTTSSQSKSNIVWMGCNELMWVNTQGVGMLADLCLGLDTAGWFQVDS
jgi:hypothetical protein